MSVNLFEFPIKLPFLINSSFKKSSTLYPLKTRPLVKSLLIKTPSPLLVNIKFLEKVIRFLLENLETSIDLEYGLTIICALKPKILFTYSVLKPFITDITIIKTATPKLMPINEKIDIIFKKPSFFLGLKYLKVIFFSNVDIKFYFFV